MSLIFLPCIVASSLVDLAISKVVCEDNNVLYNGECTSTQGMFFPHHPSSARSHSQCPVSWLLFWSP